MRKKESKMLEKEEFAFGKLIKQAIKEADEGNVKEWKVVKKELLKRIKNRKP